MRIVLSFTALAIAAAALTAAGTKTIYFEGTLTAKDDDDLLLVTLPKSSTSGDIEVLEVPSDSDESNFEIPG